MVLLQEHNKMAVAEKNSVTSSKSPIREKKGAVSWSVTGCVCSGADDYPIIKVAKLPNLSIPHVVQLYAH